MAHLTQITGRQCQDQQGGQISVLHGIWIEKIYNKYPYRVISAYL